METFTEPRPEVLEWLSPARRRRQLRDGGGGGACRAEQWITHRNPSPRAAPAFHAPALDSAPQPTVHPVLKSHTPCSQASRGLGWQSVGHHSKPMIPQRLTLETDATVGVEGEPANPYVACAST